MSKKTEELRKIKFHTKRDYQKALYFILEPIEEYYREDKKGHLNLGYTGAVYSKKTQEIEAFLRPLWGIAPLLAGDKNEQWQERYLAGIKAGTNPESKDYWGTAGDYDQLLVEMASLSTALLLAKEKFWDVLNSTEQENLAVWLLQINGKEMPKSNWLFFRILVNLAMRKCQMSWSKAQLEKDFEVIDNSYVGDGWYFDENLEQRDYYVSFAFHYYGLLYAKQMEAEEAERSAILKERAAIFAKTFLYWFDEKGEAIPFGRSLTYRFAQSAFWAALVYADVEAISWGKVKGILAGNMTGWLAKNIFNEKGLLTIGYHYPNLVMAEGYNAPGSPYWALKTFLLLAVPEEHPYWQVDIEPIQHEKKVMPISEARMLVTVNGNHNQAFVAGQIEQKQAHIDAKYSKLVYSTAFGVSVSKGSIYYKQGGFDNCLALAEVQECKYYRSKLLTEEFEIQKDRTINVWRPWHDVQVHTTILPYGEWHIRIHRIEADRELHIIEGGFSVPMAKEDEEENYTEGIMYHSQIGTTSIWNVAGWEELEMQVPEPNTNLFFARSTYPTLKRKIKKGKTQVISLIGGITTARDQEIQIPKVLLVNGGITIDGAEGKKNFKIDYI